jgi:hypothetical protein
MVQLLFVGFTVWSLVIMNFTKLAALKYRGNIKATCIV